MRVIAETFEPVPGTDFYAYIGDEPLDDRLGAVAAAAPGGANAAAARAPSPDGRDDSASTPPPLFVRLEYAGAGETRALALARDEPVTLSAMLLSERAAAAPPTVARLVVYCTVFAEPGAARLLRESSAGGRGAGDPGDESRVCETDDDADDADDADELLDAQLTAPQALAAARPPAPHLRALNRLAHGIELLAANELLRALRAAAPDARSLQRVRGALHTLPPEAATHHHLPLLFVDGTRARRSSMSCCSRRSLHRGAAC